MNELDEVQRLIRLKRYETPGEDYFESFAERFKERQRSEMLRRSAHSLLFERLSMWFEEGGGAKSLIPAGAVAAAAAVAAGLFWLQPKAEGEPTVASAPAPEVPGDAVVEKEDAFELQLPRTDERIAGLPGGATRDRGFGLVPVGSPGARGGFREL